ncbi:MAG: exodeoxyribonuclease V subunit gamma [Spirochaetes bacterium]|nr:exodeoxyribonuclease V subunit gamma [Spirochaetota bacterium]
MNTEFYLYTSNNLEFLVDELGKLLFKKRKNDILSPHTIIVQSLGMQRWISLQLAQRYGVFTNCLFPFPQQFALDVFKAVIPDYELSPLYENKILIWQLVKLLPQCINEMGFEQVKNYLVVDGTISQIRLYQLAHRLANLYDEYLVYFYEYILEWEKPTKQNDWQIVLWRYVKNAVGDNSSACHKAQLLKKAIKKLSDSKNNEALKEKFSPYIILFGITTLPQYYIELFKALSSVVPVHIFQLNPSKEYWFDTINEKKKLRLEEENIDTEKLKYEVGNPLLSSLGKVGAEYIEMLLDYEAVDTINSDTAYTYIDNTQNETLLRILQSDICRLINRGSNDKEIYNPNRIQPKVAINSNDRSISIHSCHSPLREVEVLRDYIIDVMNNNDIIPNDIIVMAPDIDLYAPFIQAVFDEQVLKKEGLPSLPYCIADQSYKNTSRFISAFCDLLEVLAGRLEADVVCQLLEYDEVASGFGIDKQAVLQFHAWVEELNVRWGKDSAHRKQFTQQESNAFTWHYAIERMLMGYAVPESAGIVDDIMPFDCVEGSMGNVLGCFINFLKTLFYFYDEAQKPKPLLQWAEFCQHCVNALLNVENHSQDYENIQNLFESLRAIAPKINLTDNIEFLVIKSWIEDFISEQRVSSNFLTKGITFCQLLPMRSIPFKVVCLLGMNDDFPRQDDIISFDIMRNDEKYKKELPRCIRSKRSDDRYLFLESIISAKEYLFISYQGQDPVDLSLKEPSIVVNELLEYIEQGFYCIDESQSIRDYLVTQHHLHHFHPAYFNNSNKLFSYSKMWCNESIALYDEKREYEPLVMQPVKTEKLQTVITMDEFVQFFYNPARYFITKMLGIHLRDSVIELNSEEPLVVPAGLDKYTLSNELLEWRIQNNEVEQFIHLKKKNGQIPDGVLGDVIVKKTNEEITPFIETVTRMCKGTKQRYEVEYTVSNNNINIVIRGLVTLYGNNQIFYRYGNLKAKDRIKAFLWHIFVCVACNANVCTYFITKDKINPISYTSMTVEKAKNYLNQCIELFVEGSQRIIPFFPETSYMYFDLMMNGKTNNKYYVYNLEEKFYNNSGNTIAEYDDPYIQRAFYKVSIFQDESIFKDFREIATKVFGMITECQVL